MLRCNEKYVNRNLWKFYKKEKIFMEILNILLLKFEQLILEKFIEILGKLLGMNVAKILRKVLGNFG